MTCYCWRMFLIANMLTILSAYLMGCPIRGVILDPIVAMQMGIQGQVCLFAFYFALTLL